MTESPPRPEMPPGELDAAPGSSYHPSHEPPYESSYGTGGTGDEAEVPRAFIMPPAPLPVAPWWASSTPDPTPPPSVADPPATVTDGIAVATEPSAEAFAEPSAQPSAEPSAGSSATPAAPPVDLAGPPPVEQVPVEAPPVEAAPVGAAPVGAAPVEEASESPYGPPYVSVDTGAVPAARPPAPIETNVAADAGSVALAPVEVEPVAEDPAQAPPAPPADAEAPAPAEAPHAVPRVPDTVVDQVVSTGPQPSVGVQEGPAWDGPRSHWTPSRPAAQEPARAAAPAPAPAPAVRPAPSPARARRRKAGLMALLAAGVGVAAAAAAAVLVALPRGEDVPLRKVAAPGAAGGLQKDASAPAVSAAYPFILAAARAGGVEKAITASGVYRDPATGTRSLLFLGGTAQVGDPVAFLKKARPSTVLKVDPAIPGKRKAGGRISCGTFAVLAETHLYCAWATENSFGFVASNEPAGADQPSSLLPLTQRMRADLEKRAS